MESVPVEMPIHFRVIAKKVEYQVSSLRLRIELLFFSKDVKFEQNELMSHFESAIALEECQVERKVVCLEGRV